MVKNCQIISSFKEKRFRRFLELAGHVTQQEVRPFGRLYLCSQVVFKQGSSMQRKLRGVWPKRDATNLFSKVAWHGPYFWPRAAILPSVSAEMGQEERPIEPVPNIRTSEGYGIWETLILPRAPPLYRPYSLLDEEAGISSSAKDARGRSKDRKKTKDKEGKTWADFSFNAHSSPPLPELLTEEEGADAANGKMKLSHDSLTNTRASKPLIRTAPQHAAQHPANAEHNTRSLDRTLFSNSS